MTGWELVQGKEPVISEVVTYQGYPQSSAHVARDEVRDALESLAGWIRISFFAGIVSLALSLSIVHRPKKALSWVLLLSGAVAAFAFLAATTVGASSDTEGSASVHHHSGYWIAMALAWIALALEVFLPWTLEPEE
jgi:hypothetical protein